MNRNVDALKSKNGKEEAQMTRNRCLDVCRTLYGIRKVNPWIRAVGKCPD